MEETARGLETNEFLALLAEEDSMGVLRENITLLLPTDRAVEEYEDFLAQQNGLGKRRKAGRFQPPWEVETYRQRLSLSRQRKNPKYH